MTEPTHQDRIRKVMATQVEHFNTVSLQDGRTEMCGCGFRSPEIGGVRVHVAEKVLEAADSIAPVHGTPRELEALRTLETFLGRPRGPALDDEALDALKRLRGHVNDSPQIVAGMMTSIGGGKGDQATLYIEKPDGEGSGITEIGSLNDLRAARLLVQAAVCAKDMLDYIADVLPEDQAKEIR